MTILITGNSRTGTTLLLTLFELSGMNTGYIARQLIRVTRPRNRGRLYDLRGGYDFFYDISRYSDAKAGKYPEVIKQAYGLKYIHSSPFKIIETKKLAPIKFDAVVITYRDKKANIDSFIEMEMKRARPHTWPDREVAIKEVTWCYERNKRELKEENPSAIWLEFPKYAREFDYFWEKVGHLFTADKGHVKKIYAEFVIPDEMVRF